MIGSNTERIEELEGENSELIQENKDLSKEVSELKSAIHNSVMANFQKKFQKIPEVR